MPQKISNLTALKAILGLLTIDAVARNCQFGGLIVETIL